MHRFESERDAFRSLPLALSSPLLLFFPALGLIFEATSIFCFPISLIRTFLLRGRQEKTKHVHLFLLTTSFCGSEGSRGLSSDERESRYLGRREAPRSRKRRTEVFLPPLPNEIFLVNRQQSKQTSASIGFLHQRRHPNYFGSFAPPSFLFSSQPRLPPSHPFLRLNPLVVYRIYPSHG